MSAQFEILEAGLSSRLETSGYRLMLPGGISMVSPGPGITPGAGDIVLKQNLSFGTGHHPTTELSIRLLREAFTVADIKAVFDLGTGSGILALYAAKLGASRILAVDIDPRACKEALEAVRTNDIGHRVFVVQGSIEAARPGVFDLVLANLTIGTLRTLAREIPGILRNPGFAVISGFTTGQVDQILRYIGTTEVIKNINQEGWAAVLIRTTR
ncbi:MAG: 50S ribosomal protein L11 methyltransferase [Deltaproteobacteria bacterium]|nr:50S ribosomal protein L11 methyltransferase [Deltaproteobacteria bacterium]